MDERESNSLLMQDRTDPDGATDCSLDIKPHSSPAQLQEKCYNLVMNEHKLQDMATGHQGVMTNGLSPPSLFHDAAGDAENGTTSSVASCCDSGICSTPHNEEDLNGFEDIPLNVGMDFIDGMDAVNFGDSLSEKLKRMDVDSGSNYEGKKSRGKLR